MARGAILIVEDDEILAIHLANTLKSQDYDVMGPVATGEAAVAAVTARSPDLVLVEFELPGPMSGVATAQQIHAVADVPVVFLADGPPASAPGEAASTMPYVHLIKPVSVRELAITLDMVLYRRAFDAKIREGNLALRASEERYRLLFQSNVAAIALHEIIYDGSGMPCDYRFLQVNATFERVTGLRADDVIGRRVLEVLPDTEPSWIARYGKVALTREPIQFEEYSAALDRFYDVTAYSPAPGQFAVSFLDVTARKRAEDALRETLAELTLIHDNVPVAMLILDAEKRVVKANAAAAKSAGHTPEEMIGLQAGEAFCCLYALDDPHGCGYGASCTTCPMRCSVLETLTSGVSCRQVEAWLPLYRAGGDQERCLLVSTDRLCIGGHEWVLVSALDITEAKRSEQQLRNQMEFVAALLETMPLPVFYNDTEGRYLGCNGAFEEFWGRPKGYILGRTVYDVCPKDIADCYAAMDAVLFEHRTPQACEWKAVRWDGSVRQVIINKAPFMGADRKVAGLVGVILDITERKRAEDALRDAEARYRLLFEQSPDGILIIDPATARPVEFNETAHRQLGYSREEFARLSIADIDAVQTPEEARTRIAGIKHDTQADFDTQHRTRHGELRDVHVTERCVDMAGHLVYHCVWRDITERKRAEEAVRQGQAELEAALASMTDAVFISDAAGQFTHFNDAFASFHKFKNKTECARSLADYPAIIDVFMPNGKPAPLEKWAVPRALRGEVATSAEYTLRRKDTGETWVGSYSFGPIRGKDGRIIGSVVVGRDITARKRAEEAMRFQAMILNQIADMVTATDLKGNITYVNDAEARALGYPKSELLGRSVADYGDDPKRGATQSEIVARTLAEGSWRGEVVNRDSAGREIVVDCRTQLLHDAAGRPVGLCGISTNITEQKRAEEALRQSEAKYRRLHESMTDAFVLADMSGRILECNHTYCEMLGYTDDELRQMTYADHTPEKWRALEARIIQEEVLAHEFSAVYEKEYRRKDGTVFPAELRMFLIRDEAGQPVSMWAIVRDITERKRAEEALRESEARVQRKLKSILSPTDDLGSLELADIVDIADVQHLMDEFYALTRVPNAIIDLKGNVLIATGWQDICTQFHRCHPDTLKNCIECDTVLSKDVVPGTFRTYLCKNSLWDCVTPLMIAGQHVGNLFTGQFFFEGEIPDDSVFRAQAAQYGFDEDAYMAAVRRVPIWSRDRIAVAFEFYITLANMLTSLSHTNIVLARTLEERKHAEEAREKLEAQLRQAQKMEAVGQLAGGVAHDFNNLLQVISGYCDILSRELKPGTRGHLEVNEVMKAAERAGTLVRQLLAFSRRDTLRQQALDLNEVIRDLTKMLRRVIGEHITLRLDLAGKPLNIWADRGQVEQIIMNLCVNSRDAMPQGGELVVETQSVELDEDFVQAYPETQPGEYVRLCVSDTGHGMKADVLERIFEPFFTTKEVGKGTGLGLATVYGIVKQHGGIVTCASELEKGTAFSVYLPEVFEVPDHVGGEDANAEIAQGTETILFAEDEQLVRNLGRQFLTSGGYRVLAAKDGHEALALYKAHAPSIGLIVLDVVMPGLSGKAVADQIKAENPKIPILFTSGYDFQMLENTLSSGEAAEVVHKPYKQSDLLRRIRELLDAAHATGPEHTDE